MSGEVTARGRCLCGAITYECSAAPNWTAYCHCQSCRLNTASPATAFFGMANDAWEWTGQPPNIYESNPGVRRYFCASCGTPVAYEADKFPGEIHFYVAALEDTKGFEPRGHVHFGEHLDWFDTRDELKRATTTFGSPTASD